MLHDAIFLDGAAVVHMLHPGTARSFQDYADMVFSSYILSQLQNTNRVDIVWDVHMEDSLKATTREKRGKGVQRRVASTTVLPSKWKDFLHLNDNKTEIFRFLSKQAIRIQWEMVRAYMQLMESMYCARWLILI